MLTGFSMTKAETVQVGSGTERDVYLPLASNWNYSYSQQIYTIAEIGHTGTITSIAFKAQGDMGMARTIDLYLVETDKSSFSSESDFVSCSESNKVFSGSVTFTVGDWTTLSFDTPFEYNGSKNLCVIVNDKTGSYVNGSHFYVYLATDQSLARINDSYGAYDPASPGSTHSNNTSRPIPAYKSQLQLTFADGGGSDTGGTIQVGSGLTTQFGLPFPSNWNYSYSEQIYTIAEIGKTGTITSLAFKAQKAFGQAKDIDLYLVKTSKSSFSSNTDFVTASESDKVFSGSVTFAADDWTTITFSKPFQYDGTTNLCVIVNNKTGSYSTGQGFYIFDGTSQSIVRYNDSSGAYNPASPGDTGSNANPSLCDYKAQLQLTFADGGGSGSGTTIQVGSGTETNFPSPTNTCWMNTYSQQIYLASEITKTGTITSLAFCAQSCNDATITSQSRTLDIYMLKTSKSYFSSNTDWLSVSESDKVYSGTVTFTVGEWTTITLNKPFEYDGTANLCIVVNDKSGSEYEEPINWLSYWKLNNKELLYKTSSSSINPLSPPTGTLFTCKAQLQLTFADGGGSGTPITAVYVNGYEPPVAGENSQNHLNLTVPSDANYSINYIGWYDDDAEKYFYDNFVAGTHYSLYAKLIANDGYYFADDCTFYLNDGTDLVDKSYSKVDQDDNTHASLWSLTAAATGGGSVEASVSAPASADFETGDFSQIAFDNDPTYPWIVTSDDAASGTYCMMSGNSGLHNTSSAISVTVSYDSDGYIRFEAKCMGEGENTPFDKCIFYIDGEEQFTYGNNPQWDNYAYNVTAGTHTFMWKYTKDASISATTDAFLVDNVEFAFGALILPPTNLTVSDIQWNSATIAWESEASAFNLQYKTSSSSEWTTISSITATSYTLTDLKEQTTYQVRVQTAGSDMWTSTTFITSVRFPRPSDLQVLAVTPYTAILDWTDNCGASAWQLVVDNNWENIIDVTHKPFILTGLTSGVLHIFTVRAVMEVDGETLYSSWSEDGSFITPVPNPMPEISSVTTTPNSATITWEGKSKSYKVRYRSTGSKTFTFSEDFEGLTDDALPVGWTAIDSDGDGYNWFTNSNTGYYTYSGVGIAASASYNNDTSTPLTPDNWLITPKVTLGNGASAWLRGQDPTYSAEHFAFYVSTTDTDPSNFTKVSNEYVATGEYEEYTADLSAYAGQEGYVAIRHYNVTDMFLLNVDDFGIYETEGEWTVIETTDKSVTIEGLAPDTEYEFDVTGIMQGQEDANSGIKAFKTLETNPVPFDVVARPSANTANISWTGYGDTYQVLYKVTDEITLTTVAYSEDFEGTSLEGWTSENLNSGSIISSGAAYNGAQSFRFYYTTNPPQYLISPELSGITEGALLKFQYHIWSTDYPESYKVGYSKTTNDISAFTWTDEMTYGDDTGWHEYSQKVPAGTKYIAIQCTSNDKFYFYIDDFIVYNYTVVSENEWTGVYTDEPKTVLTGLEKNTTYDFKIESYVSGIDTPATTDIMQFTTKASIVDLVFDTADDNTSTISSNDGAFANVTINNLTLKSGVWQAICLPFDIDVEHSVLAGADVRTAESVFVNEAMGVCILNCLTPVTSMQAHTSYIVRWNGVSDLENPVFEGVSVQDGDPNYGSGYLYDNKVKPGSIYFYTNYSGGYGFFHLVDGNPMLVNIKTGDPLCAFEGYYWFDQDILDKCDTFLLNTGDNGDLIDGISSVEGTEEETIYSLTGMRLAKKQRGINILKQGPTNANVRKVLVK